MSSSRREEIEAKRLKLQALRKQRQEREQRERLKASQPQQQPQYPLSPARTSLPQSTPLSPQTPTSVGFHSPETRKSSVNKLVGELLVTKLTILSRPGSRSVSRSRDSSFVLEPESPVPDSPVKTSNVVSKYVDASVQTEAVLKRPIQDRPKKDANRVGAVMYDKAVQTSDFQIQKEEELSAQQRKWEAEIRRKLEKELEQKQARNKKDEGTPVPVSSNNQTLHQELIENLDSSDSEDEFLSLNKFMHEQKKSEELNTQQENENRVNAFFSQSFKIVNRALNENESTLLENYALHDFNQEIANDKNSRDNERASNNTYESPEGSKTVVAQIKSIYNELFCADRTINDIDWSSSSEELIVGAYSSKKSSHTSFLNCFNNFDLNDDSQTSDIDSYDSSVVQIWNVNYNHNIPEYDFRAPTEILSVAFNKTNSQLVYGGGYNGKIYTWDARTSHKNPIFATSTNSGKTFSHLYPVYSLHHQVNNDATYGAVAPPIPDPGLLVSASTDGTICSWSPYSLKAPIAVASKLKSPAGLLSKYDELAPIAVGVITSDPLHGVLIACEDGKIYTLKDWNMRLPTASSISSSGKNQGAIDGKNIYQGHQYSPITSLSCHPSSNENLGNLFLTSGYDWNIKLWRYSRSSSNQNLASSSSTYNKKKFTSFANSGYDYLSGNNFSQDLDESSGELAETIPPTLELNRDDIVMDVKWRHNHSSQFASVGASGQLEYWDLLQDTISPILEIDSVNDATFNMNNFDRQKGREDDVDTKEELKRTALTKVAFSGDGTKVAVGSLNGYLNIFKVEDEGQSSSEVDRDMVSMFF